MLHKLIKQIKATRISKGITLDELSEKSGVSKKHISNIENLKSNPTIETLVKLAKPLGLEISVGLLATELIDNEAKSAV